MTHWSIVKAKEKAAVNPDAGKGWSKSSRPGVPSAVTGTPPLPPPADSALIEPCDEWIFITLFII